MKKKSKPRAFVVSATESQAVVEVLSECLKGSSEIVPWHLDSNWAVGTFVLENLLYHARRYDFAIIVLGTTDEIISRKRKLYAPRDNVVFEAGLFMAHLGRKRTFIVAPKSQDLKVLSDLAGLTLLTYGEPSPKSGLVGALKPVCKRLQTEIKSQGRRRPEIGTLLGPTGFGDAHHRFREDIRTRRTPNRRAAVLNIALDMENTWAFIRDDIVEDQTYEGLSWQSLMVDGEAPAIKALDGHIVMAERATQRAGEIRRFCSERRDLLKKRKIKLEIRAYSSEPVIHGFLLNQEILTLALCWKNEKELKTSPYLLFEKNPQDQLVDSAVAKKYIELFEAWFKQEWDRSRPIWPLEA